MTHSSKHRTLGHSYIQTHSPYLFTMAPLIHDWLPIEIFSKILLFAIHSTDHSRSNYQYSNPLQQAIVLSSVCRRWRDVSTSLSCFWSDLHLSNFTYPSQAKAQDCIKAVLERSDGRFRNIALDFSSLSEIADSDDVITTALDIILAASLTSKSEPPSWTGLSVRVAEYGQMCTVSDHLLFSTSDAARIRLGHITTLCLAMTSPYSSSNSLSTSPNQPRPRPRFDTRHFKSLARVCLTHVDIITFPSTLLTPRLEVRLKGWTDRIEDTFLSTARLDPNTSPIPLNYHLCIEDSPLNIYPLGVNLSGVSRLTIFSPGVTSPLSPYTYSASSSATSSTPADKITRFLALVNLPHLTRLDLCNITSSTWIEFLNLIRQPSTPNAQPQLQFQNLRELVLLFAPYQAGVTKSARSAPSAVLGFDFDCHFGRAKDGWAQQNVMSKCLRLVDQRAVPVLEDLVCGYADGSILWRVKVNLTPLVRS